MCLALIHKYINNSSSKEMKTVCNHPFITFGSYPLINAFKNSCTFSDLPMGSNKNIKRLTARARYVAGCLSLLCFHAPKSSMG